MKKIIVLLILFFTLSNYATAEDMGPKLRYYDGVEVRSVSLQPNPAANSYPLRCDIGGTTYGVALAGTAPTTTVDIIYNAGGDSWDS